MATQLLGPPEMRLSTLTISTTTTTTATANQPKPPMGRTENNSATYLSTGNPCLDFFFHVVPDTPPEQLLQRLLSAWDRDALTSLKLVCNLRGVRGTGKSDKEGFYTAALWLHKHHPKTLACNVKAIAEFGYFKDMLEILYRLLEGPEIRKKEKSEWQSRRELVMDRDVGRKMRKATEDKEKVKGLRLGKTVAKAKKAFERYNRDPDYRFLHDRVSDLFAELLRSDMEFYNAGDLYKISLAAKWCPSLDSSYDKATLMCESVARKLFPREEYIEYRDIEETHYAYRVRDRLRKDVLVPLHEALKLPEVYICAKKWNNLPYNRVPSVAMKLYKKFFYKHDKERFEEYLEKVKSGKSTIAAGALLPHEIIKSLDDETGPDVAELQWKRMVDDMAKKGKLTNCMAICDVSGSMNGIPMEVSVALGLLISELSEEPWKGKLITFSEKPQLHTIKGDSLRSKTEFIRRMEWGMNTDFQKVFDRILEVAVQGKLREDEMIKTVFVFSDMEFDQASKSSRYSFSGLRGSRYGRTSANTTNNWETDYMVIERKYKEKGYEKVPQIVFWNLRNSVATPVPSKQKGVALVSGFSKNLVTLFLEGGILSPEAVMLQAISGEEYQKLVVLD
ncbi:hypothetical protein RHMOL_Rhmol02G0039600 [Rhododendron molle]|uniref:Uncharacterized protein n=1 Tax=Rhododendron molle TaxID=49168 RepID=A0ACC0PLL6_RHOML|nr:hypothetical protein RHMOL_Rhmol02G0039600 [Rhododendron molle]